MLYVFFLELSHFEQPLSGEVWTRMKVWQDLINKERVIPPDGWGIDVWFLKEAAMSGHKIKEVYVGRKDHTFLKHMRKT